MLKIKFFLWVPRMKVCREIYKPFWLKVEILFDLLSKTQVGLLLVVTRVLFNHCVEILGISAFAESDSFIKPLEKVFIFLAG